MRLSVSFYEIRYFSNGTLRNLGKGKFQLPASRKVLKIQISGITQKKAEYHT